MRTTRALNKAFVWAAAMAVFLGIAPLVNAQGSVPAGTRFMVELRDELKAEKVKVGKKFEARTLEALQLSDGSWVDAGAKLKGRVSYVRDREIQLAFERIETRRGKVPIVARVVGVVGEKGVRERAGDEGEIKASGGRGRNAAIGAAVGAGVGAAVGAAQGGGKGAAIGAAAGAGGGALIGAASGGRDLVLREGARLEVELERPLYFSRR